MCVCVCVCVCAGVIYLLGISHYSDTFSFYPFGLDLEKPTIVA